MKKWKTIVNNIPSYVQASRKGIYEVSWIDEFKDSDNLGETHYDPKRIIIKTNQSDKETVFTFVHEYFHAMSEEYQINLTETQVLALEQGFYYLLKNMDTLLKGKRNDKKSKKRTRRITRKV